MKKNEGKTDRIIRVVLGLALLSLFFILDGNWRWISLLGVIVLITGITGICLIYLPFGFDTRKK